MKIRLGFVSNSSSASFCIFGLVFEDDEGELCDKVDKYNKLNNTKLVCESPLECSSSYVGLYWYDIKDNETGKEFKDRIQYLLNSFCEEYNLPKLKCATYEESWYN